jgi:hypothetical protein
MGITREEQLLKSVATGVASDIKPITREEQYLSYIGGGSSVLPAQPITRKEVLLDTIAKNGIGSGGGGGVTINNQDKTITENGTYTADEGYTGLGTVTVSVAPPPSEIDKLINGQITEISSGVTYAKMYAFAECGYLASADFPLLRGVHNYMFQNCGKLTDINFPSATNISKYAFSGCGKLTSVSFPLVTLISDDAFDMCRSLMSADFPLATKMGRSVFSFGYSLKRLILRAEALCTLSNVDAFSGCVHFHGTVNATYNPEGLKDGYIYVPSALIESYKTATNWSNFATQFRALEDYTVDGTTTGALDESKI